MTHVLHREGHHRPRGPRARPQASRHVHRRRRRRRPASPGLGDPRQLDRRGDERVCHPDRRDPARRREFDHRHRRWARHPGGRAREDEEDGARADLHGAACGRQVRAGQLQDLRRPARRRRQRRQRAVEGTDRHGQARRLPVGAALPAGRAAGAARQDRRGARQRHHGVLPPRRDDLSQDRVRRRDDRAAARGRQLPAPRAQDHLRERGHAAEGDLCARRRPGRLPAQAGGRARHAAGARRAVRRLARRRAAARPGAAVDRVHRRTPAQLRQRHPDRARAARTRTASGPASARPCATSSRRTT